ncbi:MAG: DNA polymerase A family protein [Elusimicrobiota bacterium]
MFTSSLFDTTPTREAQLEQIRQMYQLPPDHEFIPVELRVAEMLREAGARGLRVDSDILTSETAKVEAELSVLQRDIDRLARHSVRVGSSADLAQLLFNELGFPCAKQTRKGKPSFGVEALKKYAHPVAALISKWKSARSTLSFLQVMRSYLLDGRIRTEFLPWNCPTGRIYCRDLNLQQVPAPGCRAIVPDPGMVFVYGDFDQAELRIMMALASETRYYAALQNADIHILTAAAVFAVAESAVTDAQRDVGKMVTYAVSYGVYPTSLAFRLGISRLHAEDYIARYFSAHPRLATWMEERRASARACGHTSTLFGHRRDLRSVRDFGSRDRMAVNTAVQGAQAGYLKLAIKRVGEEFAQAMPSAQFMMTVHDSILLQVPEAQADEAADLLRRCMRFDLPNPAPDGPLQLQATVSSGRSWAAVAHDEPMLPAAV